MSRTFENHAPTALVRKLEAIAPLSDAERAAILGLPARYRELPAGQDIVREGDTPVRCCLILEGWACRYKILGEGRRQILSFHIPGDLPDLHGLHLPVMDHSLGTMTEAAVAFIPREALHAVMLRHPRLGGLLWRETLIDGTIFRVWMVGLGRRTAFGRVAHLLCETYLKLEAAGLAGDRRCHLPIKQVELADALGLSTVHVNRILQEMRGRGLIVLHSHTLVIQDWEEMRRSSEFDPAYLHLEKRAAG